MTKQDEHRPPFGEAHCESEIQSLTEPGYERVFYLHAPFNDSALDPRTYLIIGRRGSGKTALTKFFRFQREIAPSRTISLRQADASTEISEWLDRHNVPGEGDDLVHRVSELWNYVFWILIFNSLYATCEGVRRMFVTPNFVPRDPERDFAKFVRGILDSLQNERSGSTPQSISVTATFSRIRERMKSDVFVAARQSALNYCAQREAVFLTFDTEEHYQIQNPVRLCVTSALIVAASIFHQACYPYKLYLKILAADESFREIKEKSLPNPLKSVRNPVYLHWGTKDLLRLLCWRFVQYIMKTERHAVGFRPDQVDWNDFKSIYSRVWEPHFGDSLPNRQGVREQTLPYIMRHTQLRPRQVILLCNAIADQARSRLSAMDPLYFDEDAVRNGVHLLEPDLAAEVINSYRETWPNVSAILDALTSLTVPFRASELDRVAHRTAGKWNGGYDRSQFRQLVCQLGIVGRVRSRPEGDASMASDVFAADFEYFDRQPLILAESDICVIHPMFMKRFNCSISNGRVLPFPSSELAQLKLIERHPR